MSNHALPAPSILAEQPDIVDEAKEQAVLANTPAKAAAQSPAVSEHEPSQPDETLVVAVPKCQVSISAFPSPALPILNLFQATSCYGATLKCMARGLVRAL